MVFVLGTACSIFENVWELPVQHTLACSYRLHFHRWFINKKNITSLSVGLSAVNFGQGIAGEARGLTLVSV
jgi:hypothetical protein